MNFCYTYKEKYFNFLLICYKEKIRLIDLKINNLIKNHDLINFNY